MFLRIASTPAVVAAAPKPLTGGPVSSSASAAGLGFVPRLARSPGLGFVPRVTRGPAGPVLQIPVPAFIFRAPNGLGQVRVPVRGFGQSVATNPNACQYALPGLTPIPGLAICNPATGLPPGMTGPAPMACAGIPPGGAGYEQCMEQANQATINEGYNPYVSGVNTLQAAPVTAAQVASANAGYAALAPQAITVAPAASASPAASTPVSQLAVPSGSTSYAPSVTQSSSVNSVNTGSAATSAAPSSVGSSLSFLSDAVSVFGFDVPVWMLGLGAVGVAWAVSNLGKGGR